ncbi:hypothetical protein [Pseudalkalibacillus caeni]|nr:hypothetical protein [Pseudalkalibacillus caeni]
MKESVPFLVTFFYIIVPVVSIIATFILLKWTDKKEVENKS